MIDLHDLYAMKGLLIYSALTFMLGAVVGFFCRRTLSGCLTGFAICVFVTVASMLLLLFLYPPDPAPPSGHSIGYYAQASVYLIIPYFVYILPPSIVGALSVFFLRWSLGKKDEKI
jgi:hypothetical protein